MKKYLILGLGTLAVASAYMLSTLASPGPRYWHTTYGSQRSTCVACARNYIDPKPRAFRSGCCDRGRVRPFSDRVGSFQYRRPTYGRLVRDVTLDFSHPSRRHDVWYHSQYRTADHSRTNIRTQAALNRLRRPHLYPRNENNYSVGKNVVRNGDYVQARSAIVFEHPYELSVYNTPYDTRSSYRAPHQPARIQVRSQETNVAFAAAQQPEVRVYARGANSPLTTTTEFVSERYTVDIPADFVRSHHGLYESETSSVAFRVVKTPGDYTCVQLSFELCGIDLGKDFKDSQNLTQVSQLKRTQRWDQTVGQSFVSYPTLTESFHAVGYGTANVYLIFNALDPADGSVVRIEAVARDYDTELASRVMRDIFQSFRFRL